MQTLSKTPTEGGSSPWGRIQTAREITPGIVRVTTASHGGIWLSPERLTEMPPKFVAPSPYHAGLEWFEEDCECALVMLAFPHVFPAKSVEYAKEAALRYYPDRMS